MKRKFVSYLKKILAFSLAFFMVAGLDQNMVFAEGISSLISSNDAQPTEDETIDTEDAQDTIEIESAEDEEKETEVETIEIEENIEEVETNTASVADTDTIYAFDSVDDLNYEYKLGLERLEEEFPTAIYAYYGDNTEPTEIPVEWECQDDYDETLGQYVFVPSGLNLQLADGVELPSFTVYVENDCDGYIGGYIAPEYDYEIPIYDPDEVDSDYPVLKDDELPESYNAFEEGKLPEIRDQGSEGACWAFGTLGSIEASLINEGLVNKDDIDLSELQLAYFSSNGYDDPKDLKDVDTIKYTGDDYLDVGGNCIYAARFLANMVGPVEEKYAPYRKGSSFVPDSSLALLSDYAQVQNCYAISVDDLDGIKQAIIDHGAVTAAFYASEVNATYDDGSIDKVRYSATYNSFYGTYSRTNHEVVIVGWNDNFSKEDFSEECQPSSDGAWLCRNSWGLDDYGKSGYFWLSYEDAGWKSSQAVYAFDMTSDVNDHCYSYDGSPITTTLTIEANLILTQCYSVDAGETVKSVGFELGSAGNPVDITVKVGDQTATASITTTHAGYYLVNLDNSIPITDNGTSVEVQLSVRKGIDDNVTISLESVGTKAHGSTDSYISWTGTCSSGSIINSHTYNYDSRIKLFTDDTEASVESTLSFTTSSIYDHAGTTYQLEFTDESIPVENVIFSSVDEDIATVSEAGLVTVGSKKGSTVIKASYGGQVAECTVKVKPYSITYILDNETKYFYPCNSYYPGDEDNCVLREVYKEGYSLSGWYTEPELTNRVDDSDLSEGTYQQDLTLYPKFSMKTLYIHYYPVNSDLSGYSASSKYITYTNLSGMPYTLSDFSNKSTNPLKDIETYNSEHEDAPIEFDYWSLDAEGEEKITEVTVDYFNFHQDYDYNDNKIYSQDSRIYLYAQYKTAATASGTCGDNLTWSLYGTKLVISGTGEMPNFIDKIIDDEIVYTVPWSDYSESITEIAIDDGITYISPCAFVDCTSLESVSIADSVEAFGDIVGFENIDVTFPNDVDFTISGNKYSPAYCYAKSIGKTFIDVGTSTLSSTPTGTYGDASWSLDMSTGVLTISGTGSLGLSENLYDTDDSKYSGDETFTASPWHKYNGIITSVIVESGITEIGELAFCGDDFVEMIELPDTLTKIDPLAFMTCYSLENISIPENVEEIGEFAFFYCRSLSSISIPSKVKYIEEGLCFLDYNLTNVELGENVIGIKDSAFYIPSSFPNSEGQWTLSIDKEYSTPNLTEITLPDSVEWIDEDGISDNIKISARSNSPAYYYAKQNGNEFASTGTNEETYLSGQWGENECDWSLDLTSGILSVSGEGRLGYDNDSIYDDYDYDYHDYLSPWYGYRYAIKNISIGDEINELGTEVFLECDNAHIDVPASVTKIDTFAFSPYSTVRGFSGSAVSEYDETHSGYFEYYPVLSGNSLLLDGSIGVNYYLQLDSFLTRDADAYVQISLDGADLDPILISNMTTEYIDGQKLYKFNVSMPPARINDEITLMVCDGDGNEIILENANEGKYTYKYSVAKYISDIEASTDEKYASAQALVKALDNYCKTSECYFLGTGTQPDLDEVAVDSLADYEAVFSGNTNNDITYYGSSLVLNSGTSIRHYFKGDAENASFTVDDESVSPVKVTDGLFYISIENIKANELDKTFVVKMDDYSLNYSALSYAYSKLSKDDSSDLSKLVKAMYLYNKAADAYIGE